MAAACAKLFADDSDGGLSEAMGRWRDSDIRAPPGCADPPPRLAGGRAEGPRTAVAAPQCAGGAPRGSSLGKRRALDDPGAVHVVRAKRASA